MKIAHLCLSNFYYDNFSYQENLLVRQNVNDGHDVKIIASLESLDKNGKIKFQKPGTYMGSDGAEVTRLEYSRIIPSAFKHKVRAYNGLFERLLNFDPDIIYFHGLSAYELLTLKKYKIFNPSVKIILDCHSDKYNSATTLKAKLLHNLLYKPIFRAVLPYIDKIFCISLETMDFAIDYYKAPKRKVEFFPLGGNCLDDDSYFKIRKQKREFLKILDEKIVLLHTGKINKKKKTIETLREFSKVDNENLIFILAGVLELDVEQEILSLIEADSRIRYIGWIDSSEMQDFLCASDLYVQPGSQSATMQQSLCLRNAVLLANVKSHVPFVQDNGWLINDITEISEILKEIVLKPEILISMSNKSYDISLELLSYKKLANRVYLINL